MTWSSKLPRGLRHDASSEAAPLVWSPDELALDTRALHDAVCRSASAADRAEVPAEPTPESLERELQEAYQRGYEHAQREGELAEAMRLRGAVHALADALETLHADADKWVGNAEENICALAVAIARQVIGREVAVDKSTLSSMVQQALGEFPLDQALTLRVNPLDLQTIHSAFGALGEASPLASRKDVQWLPDARIAAGGCLIEGRDRIVDGRVDTALERLYRRLTYTGA